MYFISEKLTKTNQLLNQNKNFLLVQMKFQKRYINAFLIKTKKQNGCNTVNRPIAIIAT